jgi:hypothetical protein
MVLITSKRTKAAFVPEHRLSRHRTIEQSPRRRIDHPSPDTDLPVAGSGAKPIPPESGD